MIGTRIAITRATHTGKETILGHVTTPLEIAEAGEVTHVTVVGHVAVRRITGLPLPLEPEEAEVRLELIPLAGHTHLLQVELL